MCSSDRLFNRQTTLHQILGGGLGREQFIRSLEEDLIRATTLSKFRIRSSQNPQLIVPDLISLSNSVADVMLWRSKNVTVGILVVTLAAWLVFEKSGYTLLSLVSSVLLLLVTIFFLWAKSAAILNRPSPPLPDLYLSEEVVNDIAALVRGYINALLSTSKDVALGKDTRLFFKVAAYLCLISIIGGLTDFLTLGYTSLVIVLTIPALYERYEDYIDRYILMGCRKLQQLYVRFDVECLARVQKWILEKKKLS